MTMLNKEITRYWIDALRSGQYKQGQEALRDETDHYCCLGVLCDLLLEMNQLDGCAWVRPQAGNPRINDIEVREEAWGVLSEESGEFEPLYLPYEAASYMGTTFDGAIRDDDGEVIWFTLPSKPDVHFASLAQANDAGATFDEIAAFLEEVVEGMLDE